MALALTVLLSSDNKIHYYHGNMEKALKANELFQTNFSTYEGIGRVIRQKQKDIDANKKFEEGHKEMMIIIKPTSASVYKNVIDALDEVMINDVRKYAIVDPDAKELNYVKSKKG